MSDALVRLFVENLPEKNFLSAIYRREIDAQLMELEAGRGAESTIALAESSLQDQPELPIALVLNSDTKQAAEIKRRKNRIFQKFFVIEPDQSRWCVAFAIPKLNAWVLADPFIKARLPAWRKGASQYDAQAVAILDLTKSYTIDRSCLTKFPDFKELDRFLQGRLKKARARAAL